MAEKRIEAIPSRTRRYALVMSEAAKRAKARALSKGGKALVTISDVFEALCLIHPESFSLILGNDIALPEVHPTETECDGTPAAVHYSSEVDRYLSPYGGIIEKILNSAGAGGVAVDSLHIAGTLIWEPIPEVRNLLAVRGIAENRTHLLVTDALTREAKTSLADRRKKELSTTFENVAKIREYLLSRCFGQDDVINAIVTQLSIAWGMPPSERGAKPLSFFFVGAPGTGKNHLTCLLQDAFEAVLGIPKTPIIDFARFSIEQSAMDLIGRDLTWKGGGHEGALTGPAASNPRGIIVIENYERGYATSISYLDTVLETGFTVDEYTQKNVCFSQNIFVIITHKKEFAESDEFLQLTSKAGGNPPRDKIIEGLVKFEPNFQSTLRLVDAPLLFRKHVFKSFFAIVREKLSAFAHRFEEAYDATCDFESEDLYRLLVDMHPGIASAHPIESALEMAILIPLQNWLMNHYGEYAKRKKIRIECDPLPDFEGAPERSAFKSFEDWMEARTKRRILQAKRMLFSPEIGTDDDAVVMRMKNLSYTMMPSIDDAGFFPVTVPDVSFSDLVGVDLVRERVSEVIDYFNHPDEGRVRPDTGIILYGPPGTGKTSVAKAIAKELGVPFIMASGADFSKPQGGAGVELVKSFFAAARRYGAVVFIDEIDGIGSRDNSFGENARVINAFLTELDGFHERNMLVIGATNRYEILDEALVRPGRLSLKIQLGLLHREDDRKKLIEETLAKVHATVSQEIIEKLVKTTNSWSPAKLVAMVNGGIRIARREGKDIDFLHFVKARTVVLLGEDPQWQEGSVKEMHITAVHEAGHAVTAVLHGIPFVQATIQGVGSTAGFVEHLGIQGFSTAEDIEKLIDMTLGGRAAEELLAEPSDGVQSDFEHATHLAAKMILLGLARENVMVVTGEETAKEFILRHNREIEDILRTRMNCVQRLLLEHRDFLEAVSDALETQKLLFEADIVSIKANLEAKA